MTDGAQFPPRNDDDAKAWFYLDHRRDIEAWVALRDDAASVLLAHLLTLESAVQSIADDVGCEFEAVGVPDGQWVRLGLWRPTWCHGGLRDLSICIEWERDALLVPGDNCWPYVAVRSEAAYEKPRWTELVAALEPARAQLRAQKARPWPLWRYEQPPADAAGVSPESIALGLLTSLRELWEFAAPALDGVHLKP